MTAKDVHYVGSATQIHDTNWRTIRARLMPIDHPDERLNDNIVITSEVLFWRADGVITTRNHVYVPIQAPDLSRFAQGLEENYAPDGRNRPDAVQALSVAKSES